MKQVLITQGLFLLYTSFNFVQQFSISIDYRHPPPTHLSLSLSQPILTTPLSTFLHHHITQINPLRTYLGSPFFTNSARVALYIPYGINRHMTNIVGKFDGFTSNVCSVISRRPFHSSTNLFFFTCMASVNGPSPIRRLECLCV